MRGALLGIIAVGTLAIGSQTASGADMRLPPGPSLQAPAFNWTGLYLGGHGGYGSGTIGQFKPKGGFGGGQIGYNYQAGNVVIGVEADGAAADLRNTLTAGVPGFGASALTGTFKADELVTVRLRGGYAVNNVLVYGTVGGGWAHGDFRAMALSSSTGGTAWHSGAAGGGGVEWAFLPNWTVKAEYLYYGLNGATYPNFIGTVQSSDLKISTVKFGINYLFH